MILGKNYYEFKFIVKTPNKSSQFCYSCGNVSIAQVKRKWCLKILQTINQYIPGTELGTFLQTYRNVYICAKKKLLLFRLFCFKDLFSLAIYVFYHKNLLKYVVYIQYIFIKKAYILKIIFRKIFAQLSLKFTYVYKNILSFTSKLWPV